MSQAPKPGEKRAVQTQSNPADLPPFWVSLCVSDCSQCSNNKKYSRLLPCLVLGANISLVLITQHEKRPSFHDQGQITLKREIIKGIRLLYFLFTILLRLQSHPTELQNPELLKKCYKNQPTEVTKC